jgi:hypothetical protein
LVEANGYEGGMLLYGIAVVLLVGGLLVMGDRGVRGLAWACVAIGGWILAWPLVGLARALIGRPDSADFWDRFSFWAAVATAVVFVGTGAVAVLLARKSEKQAAMDERMFGGLPAGIRRRHARKRPRRW